MSPRRRGQSSSTQPSGRATITGNRRPSPRLVTGASKGQEQADRLAPGHTRGRVRGHGKTLPRDRGARVAVRCPCCEAINVDTRHARICPGAGAQVNQHQPLLHAISGTLKRLGIPHQVESGEPFTGERNLRMNIVIRRGSLRDAATWNIGTSPSAGRLPCRPASTGTPARRQC